VLTDCDIRGVTNTDLHQSSFPLSIHTMPQTACGKRICQSSKIERLEVKNIEHLWENILPKTCLTAENRNKTGKLSEET
jgi:hypothetical protein